MPLPIVTLPIVERWDCHQCGVCCRGTVVTLNEQDLARLEEQKWQERPEFRGVAVTAKFDSQRRQLAKRPDGSCVFLMEDGLCRIHKEFGFEAKPLICRMFPLQLVAREKDAVLALRRACPSAAADLGRPIEEHLRDARSYAAEGRLIEGAGAPPVFKRGEPAAWKRSRLVLEALRRAVADERFPPVRRLVHGLELCRLLEQAQTADLPADKLAELVRVLEQHLPAEAAEHFEHRERPAAGAGVLFRQIALDVARLHPKCHYRPSLGARLRMAGWALKMVWGRGKLPRVCAAFPAATFAQVEEPLARLTPELLAPLDRFFQTTTASYQYAVAQRNGWSLIESFRQLALLYPLGLWLARWVSVNREPVANDMFEIISALDRSLGFSPLTGRKQRSRLATLARLGALPTLVAWYGR